jgi:hypothetical protein
MVRDRKRRRHSPLLDLFPVLTALALLTDCGGNAAAPTSGTAAPVTQVLLEGNDSLAVEYVNGMYFTTDRAGVIDVSVDYTHDDSRIVVWIAKGQCTFDQFKAETCTYSATSFTGGKPRKISVTGAAAGTYTLIVGNGGPRDEQISYKITLTSPGNVALAEGSPMASTSVPAAWRGPFSRQ